MLKIILISFIVLLLIILQISFITPNSSFFPSLNLIILFLAFFVFYGNLNPLLWWSLVVGFTFDLFSIFPFGIGILIVMVTAITLHFLFQNFLTNRSLYTFVLLTIMGTIIYNLLFLISSFLLRFLNISRFSLLDQSQFWKGLLWQILLNVCLALFLFILSHFFSNRFQKKFMVTKKNL